MSPADLIKILNRLKNLGIEIPDDIPIPRLPGKKNQRKKR